jgi:uncharacterized protein YeaO (DUF488 family)
MDAARAAVNHLIEYIDRGRVTLLYGSRDLQLNTAAAWKAYLEQGLP